MRLCEFSGDDPGTYVAAFFDDLTIDLLTQFQEDACIPNPVLGDDLHTTIVYSRKEIDWKPAEELDEVAEFASWKLFGEEKNCLVMTLNCDYLHERYGLSREMGATYDFPNYVPHVTLSYDIPEDFDLAGLPEPSFQLTIAGEYKKALDED